MAGAGAGSPRSPEPAVATVIAGGLAAGSYGIASAASGRAAAANSREPGSAAPSSRRVEAVETVAFLVPGSRVRRRPRLRAAASGPGGSEPSRLRRPARHRNRAGRRIRPGRHGHGGDPDDDHGEVPVRQTVTVTTNSKTVYREVAAKFAAPRSP